MNLILRAHFQTSSAIGQLQTSDKLALSFPTAQYCAIDGPLIMIICSAVSARDITSCTVRTYFITSVCYCALQGDPLALLNAIEKNKPNQVRKILRDKLVDVNEQDETVRARKTVNST